MGGASRGWEGGEGDLETFSGATPWVDKTPGFVCSSFRFFLRVRQNIGPGHKQCILSGLGLSVGF